MIGHYDQFEHAWRIYLNMQDMIKYADQKVQVVIALATVMITFVLAKLEALQALDRTARISVMVFLTATVIFFACALLALLARSDTLTGDRVPKLIYFGHIAKRKEAVEYTHAFRLASPESALDDICYQIAELGSIASKKFTFYRYAWFALGAMLLSFLVLIGRALL